MGRSKSSSPRLVFRPPQPMTSVRAAEAGLREARLKDLTGPGETCMQVPGSSPAVATCLYSWAGLGSLYALATNCMAIVGA